MCICSRDDRVAREYFVGSQLNCYFSQSDIFFFLLKRHENWREQKKNMNWGNFFFFSSAVCVDCLQKNFSYKNKICIHKTLFIHFSVFLRIDDFELEDRFVMCVWLLSTSDGRVQWLCWLPISTFFQNLIFYGLLMTSLVKLWTNLLSVNVFTSCCQFLQIMMRLSICALLSETVPLFLKVVLLIILNVPLF
jgi:hypothetical protein